MTPEEFNALPPQIQQTLRAGLLMQQMLADNETSKVVTPAAEAALKKLNPSITTMEDRAAPIVEKLRKEFDDKLAKVTQKTDEEKAVEALNKQIAAAKERDGFTDEGISNVLKMMQECGVGDFDVAKKAYLHDNPAPPPAPAMSSTQMDWNVYEGMQQGDAKDFFNGTSFGSPGITDDPVKWERAAALAYLDGRAALPTS